MHLMLGHHGSSSRNSNDSEPSWNFAPTRLCNILHDRVLSYFGRPGAAKLFGVDPQPIPDLLALVGDAADGYPGIPGFGAKTAARILNQHGPIESFPPHLLGKRRELALLFKRLATLRTDAPLFKTLESLRWRGATPAFAEWTKRMEAPRLLERCEKAGSR